MADDIEHKSKILSEELRLVGLELRAGGNRERALRNLATRTGVEEVGTWVTMVIQADRFGTSIASVLRVHSEMLRTKRCQRAEEAAAKITLKLLFPPIFFIFSSRMLVLLGYENEARALIDRTQLAVRLIPAARPRSGSDIRIVLGRDALQFG